MIRKAIEKDIPKLIELLSQVLMVHYEGRPDIFKPNTQKYSSEDLKRMLKDENRPIFVFVDQNDIVLGYAFCILKSTQNNNVLRDSLVLYIDDLCVDENHRGKHIGKELYDYVVDYAKSLNCNSITLNVWSCNKSAMEFYKKMGLTEQKTMMEKIL